MRVQSDEHAAEIELCWLFRQDTETLQRHAVALAVAAEVMGDATARQMAAEYQAVLDGAQANEIRRQEPETERKAA